MFNQPSTPNNDTLPITPSLIDQRSTPRNDSTHKVCEDVPALSREEFEDGYCWRSYAEKRLVGDYICYYYRCKNENCTMTRKIIYFPNGKQISQIEYHGDLHNHPKPQNVGTAFGVDGLLEEDFDITGT